MVKINGEAQARDGMMLLDFLKEAGYDSRAVAVEYNGAILEKAAYETTVLQDGDVVEVVCFMGGGAGNEEDSFTLGGHKFHSRFILGSGKYSLELIDAAVRYAEAELVTVAVRRANTKEKKNILDYVPKNVTLLPNTSGARTAEEAVRIAHLAKALGCGDFVKIEIMRDSKYLLPDNNETIRATEILAKEGFVVLPYMYPDLYAARALVDAGASAVMPLAAPIGSNKGLATKEFLQILIDEIDLRDRPANHRRRRHRQAVGGLRGDGDGRRGHHGQHGPCDGWRCAAHGLGLPRCDTRRPQGVPLGPRPRPAARCRRFRPADGLPA